jgi:hypothetical protein
MPQKFKFLDKSQSEFFSKSFKIIENGENVSEMLRMLNKLLAVCIQTAFDYVQSFQFPSNSSSRIDIHPAFPST